jgi:calcium/proton exchanger cax
MSPQSVYISNLGSAMRGKMDLSIGIALGSSMQISMFVTPFLVLMGWCINQPLSLDFPTIDIATMFLAILVVNHTVQDGESNCKYISLIYRVGRFDVDNGVHDNIRCVFFGLEVNKISLNT